MLLFCSCAAALDLAPRREDLPMIQNKVPGASYDQLSSGYTYYKLSCGACHGLYDPRKISSGKWDAILPVMLSKAKITDTTQERLIRMFVSAYAKLSQ